MDTAKKRQVKITFEDLIATVTVNGSEQEPYQVDIDQLDDDIKLKLLQYGWKQKVSDYRASDKLQGDDKREAIIECHEMLEKGEFTQKRESSKIPVEKQIEAWKAMSEAEQNAVRLVNPSLAKKLENVSK